MEQNTTLFMQANKEKKQLHSNTAEAFKNLKMSQHEQLSGNSLDIQTDMTVVTSANRNFIATDRNMSSLQSYMVDIQYQVRTI